MKDNLVIKKVNARVTEADEVLVDFNGLTSGTYYAVYVVSSNENPSIVTTFWSNVDFSIQRTTGATESGGSLIFNIMVLLWVSLIIFKY